MYQGRIEMFNKEYGLAYGNDHIVGLFVQVWSINPKFGARHFENMPDDANIKVDPDQMNTPGLDVKRITEIIPLKIVGGQHIENRD